MNRCLVCSLSEEKEQKHNIFKSSYSTTNKQLDTIATQLIKLNLYFDDSFSFLKDRSDEDEYPWQSGNCITTFLSISLP